MEGSREENYVGFVYGFQSVRKFYLAMWKKRTTHRPSHDDNRFLYSPQGFHVKLINTESDDGPSVHDAIWESQQTADISTILRSPREYYDRVWENNYEYTFSVKHDPNRCLARIIIEDAFYVVADSGYIQDCTLRGGRVGMFTMYQDGVRWSNLEHKCVDDC